jgi:hypothetical protein
MADFQREMGDFGLAALAGLPGLVGDVDQHAADVRVLFAQCGTEITEEALRTYRQSYVEAAIGRGWQPGQGFDLETKRIIAVSWLMGEVQAA